MNLREGEKKMGMKPVGGPSQLFQKFHRGFVSDLLSDVMANAKDGDGWITLQIH